MAREPEVVAELRRALGERLTIFRKAADITQGQLAAAAYLDRTTVSHIEKGRARADEAFWQTADRLTDAGGQLLTGYRQFEAAKYEYRATTRSTQLAADRAKADVLRTVPLAAWHPPAPTAMTNWPPSSLPAGWRPVTLVTRP